MRHLIIASVLLASSSRAWAESLPIPPRVGFEFGGGIQGGNMFCETPSDPGGCNDFAAALGFDLQVSWFFNEVLGITYDGWMMLHSADNFTIYHFINTIGLKVRPARILTLQAGVGIAHADFVYGGVFATRTENAAAVMAAVTVDVVRSPRFALSIELRGGTGFYGETVARNVGLGVTVLWFGF